MIHAITTALATYWPWLLLPVILFLLPLVYVALEVAAAPLVGPDEQPIATVEETLAAVDAAFEDALRLRCCRKHAGHRDHEEGGDL